MENYGVKTLLQLTETEPLKWGEVFSRKDANNDGIVSGAPKPCSLLFVLYTAYGIPMRKLSRKADRRTRRVKESNGHSISHTKKIAKGLCDRIPNSKPTLVYYTAYPKLCRYEGGFVLLLWCVSFCPRKRPKGLLLRHGRQITIGSERLHVRCLRAPTITNY